MQPHQLPRQEDVTTIQINGNDAHIVTVTDENRPALYEVAMSSYLGMTCKYCDKLFSTIAELEDTVWAGGKVETAIACAGCFAQHNPIVTRE